MGNYGLCSHSFFEFSQNFTGVSFWCNSMETRRTWARSIRPKFPVWISEIFVCRMELYFPPGRTDLVLFPLEHIFHQESLDKMLKDRNEVAVLSAVLSYFMCRTLTRIQNSTLPWYYERNLRTFLAGEYTNRANWPTGNSERPVHNPSFQKLSS